MVCLMEVAIIEVHHYCYSLANMGDQYAFEVAASTFQGLGIQWWLYDSYCIMDLLPDKLCRDYQLF